jgi:hypothetical protein
MTRGSVGALLLCLTVAGGCSSQAHVVSYNPDTGKGTVVIPKNSDEFPYYYRDEAKEAIEKLVGTHWKSGFEGYVAPDTLMPVNKPGTDPRTPPQPAAGSGTPPIDTVYRIDFERLHVPGAPAVPGTGAAPVVRPVGVVPATGYAQPTGVAPASYTGPGPNPPPGTIPSVLP